MEAVSLEERFLRGPYHKLGEKRTYLKRLRIACGFTQAALADRVGVNQSQIVWWEKGGIFLSYERSKPLGEALKERAEVLFARHNLDVVLMFLAEVEERYPGEHINPRKAQMMLDKIRKVLAYRWRLPKPLQKELNDTYKMLLKEAFPPQRQMDRHTAVGRGMKFQDAWEPKNWTE